MFCDDTDDRCVICGCVLQSENNGLCQAHQYDEEDLDRYEYCDKCGAEMGIKDGELACTECGYNNID